MINSFDSSPFFTLLEEEQLFCRSTSSKSHTPTANNKVLSSSDSATHHVSTQHFLNPSSTHENVIEENDPFLDYSLFKFSSLKNSGPCSDTITEIFKDLVTPLIDSDLKNSTNLGKRKRIESNDPQPNKTLKEETIDENDPFFVMPYYQTTHSHCSKSIEQDFKRIVGN